jgi:hypothetical protein
VRDWLRRADPAFYHKEPYLLRAQARVARYSDDAQVEARLGVLAADRMLHAVMTTVALSAYVVATGAGALDPRGNWLTVWAFAVLAVAAPRALPWWPRPDFWAWCRQALIGSALIAISAVWTRVDLAVLSIALLVGASLFVVRGRGRIALLVLAVGVLFGVRMAEHPNLVVPIAGALAAGALCVRPIARVWRSRPQVLTWAAFATLLVVCAYTFAFVAPAVALRAPVEIVAIAVAYLGVCIMAGRIRRAELMASPDGVLSLPQSIVPLLDRSRDHAVICWIE